MIEIKVCVGTSCHLKGSYNVVATFRSLIEEKQLYDQIDIKASFCMGKCGQGTCVAIGDQVYSVTPETASKFFLETVMPMVG